MPTGLASHHTGIKAAQLAARVKALLVGLEAVCRYGERIGDDTAYFEVRPGAPSALAFTVAIAPGGINIDSACLTVKELPVEEADLAFALLEALVDGRVRVVSLMTPGGRVVLRRATALDGDGRALVRQTKRAFHIGGARGLKAVRYRPRPYGRPAPDSRQIDVTGP